MQLTEPAVCTSTVRRRPSGATWVIRDLRARSQNPRCNDLVKFHLPLSGAPDHGRRGASPHCHQVNRRHNFAGIKWPSTPNIAVTHKLDLYSSLLIASTSDIGQPACLTHSKYLHILCENHPQSRSLHCSPWSWFV